MNFWRFISSVTAGKIVRGLILAFLGAYSLHFLGL
jgi:membrane protein YqaA with SNARE-associated domain